MSTQGSEVARLLSQIDAEYEAAEQGLCGLSQGSSTHRFLTARLERISCLHKRIGEVVGSPEQAIILIEEHQSQQTAP